MWNRIIIGIWLAQGCAAVVFMAPRAAAAGSYEVGDTDIGSGLKLEVQVGRFRSADSREWARPAVEVGHGLGDSLELTFGAGYGSVETDDGQRRYGAHDLMLALKWALRAESPGVIGIAIEPAVTLPTGDRALGAGGSQVHVELPLRLSRSFGRGRLTGQLAYVHADGGDERALGLGALYEYEARPGLWAGMELLHERGLDAARERETRAGIGLRWQQSERLMLFGVLGKGLSPGDARESSSARMGVEYVFD